jgi:hypothetical protein
MKQLSNMAASASYKNALSYGTALARCAAKKKKKRATKGQSKNHARELQSEITPRTLLSLSINPATEQDLLERSQVKPRHHSLNSTQPAASISRSVSQ